MRCGIYKLFLTKIFYTKLFNPHQGDNSLRSSSSSSSSSVVTEACSYVIPELSDAALHEARPGTALMRWHRFVVTGLLRFTELKRHRTPSVCSVLVQWCALPIETSDCLWTQSDMLPDTEWVNALSQSPGPRLETPRRDCNDLST